MKPLLAGAVAVVAVVGVVALADADSGKPVRSAATPTSRARALVQHFFTLLQNDDRRGLRVLLAPSFQVVRANGAVQDKASYLADPPKVGQFRISKLVGTARGGALVASYRLTVVETVGGVAQPQAPAPRLSVFHREDGTWRLVAHANFGAIAKGK